MSKIEISIIVPTKITMTFKEIHQINQVKYLFNKKPILKKMNGIIRFLSQTFLKINIQYSLMIVIGL